MRTIRASGATDREVAAVGGSAARAYDAGVRVARLEAMVAPAGSIAVQGAFLAVLGVGGYRVASGSITVAYLVAFILYLFLLVMPLGQAISAWTQLQTGLGALARIQEILALEPEEDERPERRSPAVPRPRRPAARARRRLLRLSRRARRCCAGSPSTVPAGSRVALVGPVGRGQVDDPGAGRGLLPVSRRRDPLGGHRRPGAAARGAAGAARATSSRRRRCWPARCATTCCSPGPTRPTPSCGPCSPTSASPTVVRRSPRGLDVLVGDEGVLLSGGERQRLAIARSLLARPELLLLDEPTASLDARNEGLLRDTLAAASADRALLVVAHRLSTVLDSDQIVVLDEGRVVARGTHDELVETSPLYRELATASCSSEPAPAAPPRGRCRGTMPPKTMPWNAAMAHQYSVPGQAVRREGGPLAQHRARPSRSVVFHVELQPGEAGQPHLRAQPEQPASSSSSTRQKSRASPT